MELVLAGYDRQTKPADMCKRLMDALRTPELPFVEYQVEKTG